MKKNEINGYTLSRQWFDFALNNPEMITGNHTALYFWIVELNNRLGWKEKFGLPTEHSMEAIGVRSYKTYAKIFKDLTEWGFIRIVQKSRNQYTANIIALVNFTEAIPKQYRSTVDIDKQYKPNKPNKHIVEKLDHVKVIIDYLNEKSGKFFKPTTRKTKDLIKARMGEGFTTEDFKKVINNKVSQWLTDPKMNEYLRPETLFGTKFESYLNTKISNNGNSEQLPTGEQHRKDTLENFRKGYIG